MGRRSRNRAKEPGAPAPVVATSQYIDDDGGVLTLRDILSAGTRSKLEKLESRPAASTEDRWQRRVELLFEHLAVRWEIAGLPLTEQSELLERYRMATSEERRGVRQTLARHLRTHHPEIEV